MAAAAEVEGEKAAAAGDRALPVPTPSCIIAVGCRKEP